MTHVQEPAATTTPGPLDAGSLLCGRYELLERVGVGGMSTVWRAHDRRLGRFVAVKVIRDEHLGDPAARERFEREGRVAAGLHSRDIVSVYDVGSDDHRPFLVMELVEGTTLADRLRDGPLDPAAAVEITQRVLAALEVAHATGTVHRDVKPANVLLSAGGGAKLADFGIAKAFDETTAHLTVAGEVLGTPTYLSPEQVAGRAASPRSDVYATGTLLYEMLTGHPPFTGETPLAVALARQQRDPRPLRDACPDLDPALAEVVDRALVRDPAARFQDAREMRAALEEATGSELARPDEATPGGHVAAAATAAAEPGRQPDGTSTAGDDLGLPTMPVDLRSHHASLVVGAADEQDRPGGAGEPDETAETDQSSAEDGLAVTRVQGNDHGQAADDDAATAARAEGADAGVGGLAATRVHPAQEDPGQHRQRDPQTLVAPAASRPDQGLDGSSRTNPWLIGAGAVAALLVAFVVIATLGTSGSGSDPATDAADAAVEELATVESIGELEALLREDPERWGTAALELADHLLLLAAADGAASGEVARTALDAIGEWAADDRLDAAIAERAGELVFPLALLPETAPDEAPAVESASSEGGPSPGRGTGRGRGR